MLPLKLAFDAYNKSLKGISPKKNQKEQSEKKLFYHSMVKYDNRAFDDNTSKPLPVSKNYINISLNKKAASSSLNYRTKSYENPPTQNFLKIQKTWTLKKPTKAPRSPKNPKAKPRPIVSPEPYICTCCNLPFRRKVTYDQHIKDQQRKSSSSIISISSSDESESPQMKRKRIHKKKSEIEDPTFYPDDY